MCARLALCKGNTIQLIGSAAAAALRLSVSEAAELPAAGLTWSSQDGADMLIFRRVILTTVNMGLMSSDHTVQRRLMGIMRE
ncbi:hypothetical protein EYF80_034170 [Liparis tanakae]|uniref:Uncharacterized protein n=1 Tax=Liparis tanakae TaxID=230148 RepID=A0A4Z2GSR2_9TELE|nr:hypothetical protein EYF80_034170 [Liparis tanakae]